MRIIDKKGTWVRNAGEFALPDYPRGTETPDGQMVMLQPGEPTKVNVSDYLKGQPMLQHLRQVEDGEFEVIEPEPVAEPAPEAAPEAAAPAAEPEAAAASTGKKK
jgi:hypothetical protein